MSQVQTQLPMFVPVPGKCAQLHALWKQAAQEQGVAILPRKYAVALGESRGFNPATARTQFQVWFKTHSATSATPAPAAMTPEFAAATAEYAAPMAGSQTDAPVANATGESPQEPAAPVADEPPAQLTKAQRRALAKSQRDAAVAA